MNLYHFPKTYTKSIYQLVAKELDTENLFLSRCKILSIRRETGKEGRGLVLAPFTCSSQYSAACRKENCSSYILHTAGYEETAAAGDSVMKNLREGMDGDG